MSPIFRRYCFCVFVIVAFVLYVILYSQLGDRDPDGYGQPQPFIEIGYTRSPGDDIDVAGDSKVLVNLTNFEYKIVPRCRRDEVDARILGKHALDSDLDSGSFDVFYLKYRFRNYHCDHLRGSRRSEIGSSYGHNARGSSITGFYSCIFAGRHSATRTFHHTEVNREWKSPLQRHSSRWLLACATSVVSNFYHFPKIAGNFVEAYRNLTYKHVMGLRWASTQECHHSKYIIKMDDDIVVDFFYLSNYLRNIDDVYDDRYFAGYVLSGVKPIRLRQNKWFVSYSEYDGDLYPDYLSGWMYVAAPAIARRLVHAANQAKPAFFWIDDTWVTGVLRASQHIEISDTWNSLFSANSQFLDCCLNDLTGHRYRCPFVAGPNGGDHKLITKFLQATRQCFVNDAGDLNPTINNCHSRPANKPPLTKTCVGVDKHLLVENHGAAIVNAVKL